MRALRLMGHPNEGIVVVDGDPKAVADASAAGFFGVSDSATSEAVLKEALVERAKVVIIALGRDDTAILATLTARRLSPHITVVASAREAENAELLEQGGAGSVIVSSESAGRLLGLATDSPDTVSVVEDLSFGHGLDLAERSVTDEEVGHDLAHIGVPVLAVVRGGETLRYNDPDVAPLRADDRVVFVQA